MAKYAYWIKGGAYWGVKWKPDRSCTDTIVCRSDGQKKRVLLGREIKPGVYLVKDSQAPRLHKCSWCDEETLWHNGYQAYCLMHVDQATACRIKLDALF